MIATTMLEQALGRAYQHRQRVYKRLDREKHLGRIKYDRKEQLELVRELNDVIKVLRTELYIRREFGCEHETREVAVSTAYSKTILYAPDEQGKQ